MSRTLHMLASLACVGAALGLITATALAGGQAFSFCSATSPARVLAPAMVAVDSPAPQWDDFSALSQLADVGETDLNPTAEADGGEMEIADAADVSSEWWETSAPVQNESRAQESATEDETDADLLLEVGNLDEARPPVAPVRPTADDAESQTMVAGRIRFFRAVALANSGAYDESQSEFAALIGQAAACYNVGVLCYEQGELELSRKYFQQALVHDPNLTEAVIGLRELAIAESTAATR